MRENRRIRKKKKERLNNRMALMGVTLVVMSLAAAVHLKGIELRQKDADYRYREEELAAQVAALRSLKSTAFMCRQRNT